MQRAILSSIGVLLAALVVSGSGASTLSSVAIRYPENHSTWWVDPEVSAIVELTIELEIQNFRVPEDGAVHVSGEKIRDYNGGFVHTAATPTVVIGGIEPGSHFWKFALIRNNGTIVHHTSLHIDVVVPQHAMVPQWHYKLSTSERRPRILFNLPHPSPLPPAARPATTVTPGQHRICFMSSTLGLFDAQKKIWLQAMAAISRAKWQIQVVTFEDSVYSSPFAQAVQALNVSVRAMPLTVRLADLETHKILPSELMPRLVQTFRTEFKTHTAATQAPSGGTRDGAGVVRVSMDDFARRSHKLHPPFVATLWQQTVATLHDACGGGVLVFANSNSASDQLLVDAARIAGVRAVVMELANLKPVPVHVDALVAPSHFALHHPSVTEAVVANQKYVLSTGVNTELFRPPQAAAAHSNRTRLFTIGYVGRLATEKSLALFIRAARLVAMSCRAKCHFRIIGDGPLRLDLEALAHEWGISDFVEFTGGIYKETTLVEQLQRLDVVVSPCFHETLGIAPLEAMSCGVPVVGFASGGVGEYLDHGVNGLTVAAPTAEAIRDSIMVLYRNETLRRQLGRQARRSVVQRFSYQVGAQQYIALYERLLRHS